MKGASIALACRAFGVSETCFRCGAKRNDENEMIADLLLGLTNVHKSWGFGLCFMRLRNVKGHVCNHKRVHRISCELGLNLRIKPRRRLKRGKPEELAAPDAPNLIGSMDFMADRLADGRQSRLPNALDDFNCEGLGIEGDFALPAERVVRLLNPSLGKRSIGPFPDPPPHRMAREAIGNQGRNGPEHVSSMLRTWAEKQGIALTCIQPASPSRTPMSSATTGRSGTNGWIFTSLKPSRRLRTSPRNGSGLTTTTA